MAVRCARTLTVCNHSRGSTWWGSIHATHSITHYIRDWFYGALYSSAWLQPNFFFFFYFQDGLQPTITTGWKKKRTVWLSAGVDARPTEKATSFIKQQQKKESFLSEHGYEGNNSHNASAATHTLQAHQQHTDTGSHKKVKFRKLLSNLFFFK